MTDLLRVTTSDGKYTIIQHADGHVEILRHGQPWVIRVEANVKAIVQLAYDLATEKEKVSRLERALDAAKHPRLTARKNP